MSLLSTRDISKCIKERYPGNFLAVFPLNHLPDGIIRHFPYAMIVNMDINNLPGKHWLAIYGTHTHVEVFDPLAMELPGYLKRWILRRYGSRWSTNQMAYQHVLSDLCGAYCIWYLLERYKTGHMDQVLIGLFPGAPNFNDSLISQYFKYYCKM